MIGLIFFPVLLAGKTVKQCFTGPPNKLNVVPHCSERCHKTSMLMVMKDKIQLISLGRTALEQLLRHDLLPSVTSVFEFLYQRG